MENSHLNNPKRIHEKPKHTFIIQNVEYVIEDFLTVDAVRTSINHNSVRSRKNIAKLIPTQLDECIRYPGKF